MKGFWFQNLNLIDPDSLSGLLAWWDATDSTTMRSGVAHDEATADNTGTLEGFSGNPYVADSPTAVLRNVRESQAGIAHGRLIGKTDAEVATDRSDTAGITFDGTDDYVSIPDVAHSTTTLSVSCKVTTSDSNGKRIFCHYDNGIVQGSWIMQLASTSWSTDGTPDGNELAVQISTDGTSTAAVWADANIADGSEHTVGFTFASATGTLKLYVDGVLQTNQVENAVESTALKNSTANVSIGSLLTSGAGASFIAATIRDCRIHNSVLSDAQMLAIHNESGQPTPDWHWDCLDGSATTVTQTNSLDFDGSDDLVTVADDDVLDITDDFTIALWVKPDDAGAPNQYIGGKLNGTASDNAYAILWGYVSNSVELYASGYTGTNPRTGSAMALVSSEWHHVAYSYDGVTLKGYVDGAEVISVATTFALAATTGSLILGAFKASNNHFDGHICQPRIFDSALTANQVAALVNPNITDAVTPVGHWPLDGAIEDGDNDLAIIDAKSSLVAVENDSSKQPVYDDATSSLIYDGSADLLTVADAAAIQDLFDSGATWVAWINPDSDGESSNGRILDKGVVEFHVTGESGGSCKLQLLHDFTVQNGIWQTTATEVTIGSWNMVAVVYDSSATANNPTMYVDGSSVGVTEAQAPIGLSTTDVGSDLIIGNDASEAFTFDGSIGSVLIYNVELSASSMLLLEAYGAGYWS